MGHQWSYLYLPNHPQISPIDGTLFNLGPKKEIPKQTEPSTGAIRPSNHSGTHLPWSPPVSSTKWIIFLRRFGNRVIWRGSGSPPGFCIYCKEPIRIWLEIGGKDPLANQIVPRHGRPLPCGGAISERRPMLHIDTWMVDLPLNDHNLILVLDFKCVVDQCVWFVFLYLFDDVGYQSSYLEDNPIW